MNNTKEFAPAIRQHRRAGPREMGEARNHPQRYRGGLPQLLLPWQLSSPGGGDWTDRRSRRDHRPSATIQYVNPAFTRITGYSAEEVVGQNARLLKSGRQDPAYYQDLWQTILSGEVWRGELINQRKDGYSLYRGECRLRRFATPAARSPTLLLFSRK